MAVLNLRLLGGFEARIGKTTLRLPKKAQALLAYLALTAGSTISRAKLAVLLWGDGDEDDARNNLRQVLFRVRRSLGRASRALAVEGEMVGLDPAMVDIDASRFRNLAAATGEASLQEAAELYSGDLLEGLDVGEPSFEDWLRSEREELRELSIDVHSRLLARQLQRKPIEAAIRTALRLLSLDPLQEAVHRALMRAYAGEGRRTAALRQYRLCVDALKRELQAEPEAETRRLYLEILRQSQDDEAPGAVSSSLPATRPARGQARLSVGTPLIGRDVERTRLRETLAGVGAGRGRVAVVLGEAGVGKTRLAQELVAEAAGGGWLVLEGRGHETEQSLPFALWVDAFRSAGLVDDAALVGGLAPAWRHALAPLFPAIVREGARPGQRQTEDRLRLFEALSHLVDTLAARQPLLVVLEDLHWADTTSLRFLAFLGRRLENVRTCVVGTARLDDGDASSRAVLDSVLAELLRDGRLTDFTLAPLPRPAALQLIDALTPPRNRRVSAELVERIWQMSEGNPFVVVEALRALVERPSARVTGDLALPETVRRLILTRMERLSARAHDLVAAASVAGRDVAYALLRGAAGLEDDQAAAALEELVRRRFLQQSRAGFDFTHDRIREAVLDSLLPPRRRLLHRAVARALEALHAGDLDAHFAALAFHCREGESWMEAVDYLRQASAVAAARGAFREAASILEEALALLDKTAPGRQRIERAIDIRLELGDRSMVLADFPRVERCLLEALTLATEPGDALRGAFARAVLAHHDVNVRKLDRGLRLAEEALMTAERHGDTVIETRAAFVMGVIRAALGGHPAAIAAFQSAIKAAGDDPLTMLTIGLGLCHPGARAWMAVSLAQLGRFDDAVTLGEEAVAWADEARNIMTMASTRVLLGRVHLLRGDLEPAKTSLVPAREMIDTYEIGLIRRLCVVWQAQAHAFTGEAEAALDLARQGPRVWPMSLLVESEALLVAGRLGEALAVVSHALAMTRREGDREPGQEVWALTLLGEIHARDGDGGLQLAREAYSTALGIAEALGLRPSQAHCHRGLGQVLARTGQVDAAREHLALALRLYRDMGMSRWIEPTRGELETIAPTLAAPRL
jgi:DNA-binding SARP family transcriptional activator/RecA/RadA recombinase